MERQRGEAARAQWREVMLEQQRSGKTAAAFCQERGIRRARFFWWKRQLRKGAAPAFVELRAAEEPGIELRLGGGRSVVVRRGFDARLLREVLAALDEQA